MRKRLVVVPPPSLDDHLRLGARTKPFEAQTLVAELAVEALRDAILPRLAGLDQRRGDAVRDDPGQQGPGYELRSVVAAQECRRAACTHQARQHVDDTRRADATVQIDRQPSLPIALLAVGTVISGGNQCHDPSVEFTGVVTSALRR